MRAFLPHSGNSNSSPRPPIPVPAPYLGPTPLQSPRISSSYPPATTFSSRRRRRQCLQPSAVPTFLRRLRSITSDSLICQATVYPPFSAPCTCSFDPPVLLRYRTPAYVRIEIGGYCAATPHAYQVSYSTPHYPMLTKPP